VVSVRLASGAKLWELGGKPVPAEVKEALAYVSGVGADEDASDDDIFGTSRRRSVGESWPVNTEPAARDLGRLLGVSIAARQISGQVTLAGQRTVDGIPCLEVRMALEINGLPTPAAKLPPGFSSDRPASMRLWGTKIVPVAVARLLHAPSPTHATARAEQDSMPMIRSYLK
jgi:hypothetical protein